MALRNIRANVLPCKLYLRGCLQYAAPQSFDSRDLETNEALLDEDDLDTYRSWLLYYVHRYPRNREVLYSPWLVKDYGAGGSLRIVLITCLVGEYVMRIWRALSLAEAGLHARFQSGEAAAQVIGVHLDLLRELLRGGDCVPRQDTLTDHGRFFNAIEEYFSSQNPTASEKGKAQVEPQTLPRGTSDAAFVNVSLNSDRLELFEETLDDFEQADRFLYEYCTALDLFWGTDCPLRSSYEPRLCPEPAADLEGLVLEDFQPRPVIFLDEFQHFRLFVYSRYEETLASLSHESDQYRGDEAKLDLSVVDYCLALMQSSSREEMMHVHPAHIVYKNRMLTEDLTYAVSNELSPQVYQQINSHETHICNKHKQRRVHTCPRCIFAKLYLSISTLVCGFSIPYFRFNTDVWRVLKLYIGLYLLMGNGSKYRNGL